MNLAFKIITPFLFAGFLLVGCNNKKREFKSPAGYNLNEPEKFTINDQLREISGIAFLEGNENTAIAIEDEKGKLYSFAVGSSQIHAAKFGKKGDYEDVSIWKDTTVAVLKSNGAIILFAANTIQKDTIDGVQEFNNILPEGEYEGLSTDGEKLVVLCKSCPSDKGKKEVSVYLLEKSNNNLLVTNQFKIDITPTNATESSKEKFHPSCIAKNPIRKEWYIISSVNKLLLIVDANWKVKDYFLLDPALFKQPEGITFNNKGDLYITNEGGDGKATILLYKLQK